MKLSSFLFILVFATESLYMLGPAHAQKNEHKRDRKYINLVVGLDENVKIPYMPRRHRFRGNFKRFTSVAYLRDLKTLRFSPKREGSATLTIQDARGRIVSEFFLTIRKSDLNKVAKEIQLLLSEIDGITVRIINNKVIVDGQVLLPKELSRIYSVVEQYGDKASNLVTLSPIAQRKIAEFIERDINNPQIHVRNVNGRFLLEGVADVGSRQENLRERNRAEAIAKVYFPDIEVVKGEGKVIKRVAAQHVINLIRIPPEEKPPPPPKPQDKLIQIIVHFVELNKDYGKLFRFDWSPNIGDSTKLEFATKSDGLGGVVSSITGTISNLLPKLNWAKQHGHARVLHSSSVIVKDRSPGTINSTTKIPFIGVQGGANGVATGTQFTDPVGIQSTITPSVKGSNDNIELNINFRVSAPSGNSPNGPVISENSINTIVIVRSRQSAAVGGLVSQSSATGYNKQPRTASNPLLTLFASKDFQRKQTQFVVFVTPVIKASASAGSDRIKRKFRLRN